MEFERTADYIPVNYKNLTCDEKFKVWMMRNHPKIRKWMSNPEIIKWNDHLKFLDSLSNKVNMNHYLVYDKNGNMLGSVNYTLISEGIVERGIYINPEFQGEGHAKKILQMFYNWLKDNLCVRQVITKVLKNNISSNSLEISLGAKKTGEDNDYFYYSLNIWANKE